jgi:hypothetical protein
MHSLAASRILFIPPFSFLLIPLLDVSCQETFYGVELHHAQPPTWKTSGLHLRGYIQKFPDWVDNEVNTNNKHSFRSNTKGYSGKTH